MKSEFIGKLLDTVSVAPIWQRHRMIRSVTAIFLTPFSERGFLSSPLKTFNPHRLPAVRKSARHFSEGVTSKLACVSCITLT